MQLEHGERYITKGGLITSPMQYSEEDSYNSPVMRCSVGGAPLRYWVNGSVVGGDSRGLLSEYRIVRKYDPKRGRTDIGRAALVNALCCAIGFIALVGFLIALSR